MGAQLDCCNKKDKNDYGEYTPGKQRLSSGSSSPTMSQVDSPKRNTQGSYTSSEENFDLTPSMVRN